MQASKNGGFWSFFRLSWGIGVRSFGGPAAQIELMHRVFVRDREFLTDQAFQKLLGLCTLLPGPEAQQLAASIGYKLHGTKGAITAGTLFVVPGALVMGAWSALYVLAPGHPLTVLLLEFLRPAALGLILAAVVRLALRTLKSTVAWAIAGGAGLALWGLQLPFPLILAISAAIMAFRNGETHPEDVQMEKVPTTLLRTLTKAVAGLLVWATPLAVLGLWLGWRHPLAQLGVFLSKTALSTFGGAYAVLPYVATSAVQDHAWISHPQMLDGLALGETTPGPLLLVLQFYGFMTGWNTPAPLSAPLAGLLGSGVALWTTFFPAVLWVLLTAPYAERLTRHPRLARALTGVGLAVVGALAFLGITLIRSTLWTPNFDIQAAFLTLLVLAWRWPRKKGASK